MTHYADNITESGKVKIVESLNPEFAVMLDEIYSNNGLADGEALEKWLLPQGLSIGQLKKVFHRRQIVVRYLQTLPEESPLFDKEGILEHYRQMIRSASQVANVSVSSPEIEPTSGIRLAPDFDSSPDQPLAAETQAELSKVQSPTVVEVIARDNPDEAKLNATETPVFLMLVYPVADLVVPIPRTIEANVTRRETSHEEATKEIPAAPPALAVPQPVPLAATRETVRVDAPADIAPLVELIKASVEPESWESNGIIVADTSSTALVIRQTQKAHDEIIGLVSKLRNASDQNVQIFGHFMQLTTDEHNRSIDLEIDECESLR